MKAINRDEWDAMWREMRAVVSGVAGLNQQAREIDRIKDEWNQRYPGFTFSNGRYVSHIEEALRKGYTVSDEDLATIIDADLRFDGLAFPLLNAARKVLLDNL